MKVFKEISINNFEAWSGAVETQRIIIDNDKENEFEQLIEELYPDGIDETKLNDLLRFDNDYILTTLRIPYEYE